MLLYVNGDSHCVGHGINEEFGMTNDDLRYIQIKNAPHPSNFNDSFGYAIAKHLNLPLVCQALSGSSIERTIRTTKQFVYQSNKKVFLLVGFPAINREEWYFQNKWWQITEGSQDRYPKELHIRFKNWLTNYDTNNYLIGRSILISNKITEFRNWLNSENIKHFLFSTIDPILDLPNYSKYLTDHGIVPDQWNHFKKDGHQKWAEYVTPQINDIICKR